jgi:predicted site-specific integrase-resolvase
MTASATVEDASAAPPPLRRSKAAAMLGVNPRTLPRWADAKKINAVRMPNGERRYPFDAIAPYLPPAAAETLAG